MNSCTGVTFIKNSATSIWTMPVIFVICMVPCMLQCRIDEQHHLSAFKDIVTSSSSGLDSELMNRCTRGMHPQHKAAVIIPERQAAYPAHV